MRLLKLKLSFLPLVLLAFNNFINAQTQQPSAKPSAAQQAMIKRGYGMFIHFGVNTFTDTEWSDGTTPVDTYNPTKLDCDQWVRVAKDAGFRYVLLVTKHHDGFCLWDSKYTTYDVASSPVKTDVVRAVSDACKKYGLQFAVYYSLWDRHDSSYTNKNPQVYVDYMLKQLTELFTNYGPIGELWLDGGWDRKPSDWGVDQVYALLKKLQPMCVMSVNHTIVNEEGKRHYTRPSNMTEDNKYFFQYFPSEFRLWDPAIVTRFDKKQYLHEGKSYYLPFEHTICLSKRWNWFEKSQPLPARDLDELQELFYWCTYNDNCLVVDVAPDNTGRIREHMANTVIELGKRIGIAPGKPLPQNGKFISFNTPVTASSVDTAEGKRLEASAVNDGRLDSRWQSADTLGLVDMELDIKASFNKITIFEYQDVEELPDGFSQIRKPRILQYSIDILRDGQWQTIYLGDEPMSDCKVIRFPHNYSTSKLRFKILKATGRPSINEICVIQMP
ncbi:alpha-L-fucosidase [Chitinophagaceae bacterium 26-R-25]|nr:alpha-L-fucosidase [Chitinophagaceae bacterium 26-R-25]